jgi:hypothetical protein
MAGGKDRTVRGQRSSDQRIRTPFRFAARAGGSLIIAVAVVLTAGQCGPHPAEREPEATSAQPWDTEAWQTETTVHLQRVQVHLPLLRELAVSGEVGARHVELRRSHELLAAAERSIPPVPWGVMDETTAIHRTYRNGVTSLRWSAELLLWTIQPDVPEEQRQSYQREARYYHEQGAKQLEMARLALLDGRPQPEPGIRSGQDTVRDDRSSFPIVTPFRRAGLP